MMPTNLAQVTIMGKKYRNVNGKLAPEVEAPAEDAQQTQRVVEDIARIEVADEGEILERGGETIDD